MIWLIAPGVALTIGGLFVLLFCIVKAMRVRKSSDNDDAQRAALQKLVAINMLGVSLSAFGLIMVVVGTLL